MIDAITLIDSSNDTELNTAPTAQHLDKTSDQFFFTLSKLTNEMKVKKAFFTETTYSITENAQQISELAENIIQETQSQ